MLNAFTGVRRASGGTVIDMQGRFCYWRKQIAIQCLTQRASQSNVPLCLSFRSMCWEQVQQVFRPLLKPLTNPVALALAVALVLIIVIVVNV